MVWTCLTSHGTGTLHIIDGKIDCAMYRQIFDRSLIPSAKRLLKKRKWTFQQDNDPKLTVYLIYEWFNKKKLMFSSGQANPWILIRSKIFGEH